MFTLRIKTSQSGQQSSGQLILVEVFVAKGWASKEAKPKKETKEMKVSKETKEDASE